MPFPASAGQSVGLEVWRIEKMEPAAVDKQDHGKFFSGDCYIVLKTYEKSGAIYQDLHFWLGANSTQDERGAAAYQTVFLDDQLGGKPVQYREVQGHESAKFLSLFSNLQYLDGGVDSAFRHVGPKDYKPRLFHLKGKRHVRVQQVALTTDSMNDGDVFILDCGLTLYQWNGKTANKYEKFKGLELVTQIKDNERGGKADIVVFESGKNDNDDQFWSVLGGKKAIKGESGSDDDVPPVTPVLYQLSGDDSWAQIAADSLERSMLQSEEVYLLDATNQIFLWIGKSTEAAKKKKVMGQASDYLKSKGSPDYTPIIRVVEGSEDATFKGLFKQWNPPRVVGVGAPAVEEKVDVEAMQKRQAAEEKMVDDASGKVQIWRVENLTKVDMAPEMYGQFFSGDSYIVLYTYKVRNREKYIVYFWQGRHSSSDEKGASALLTVDLAGSLDNDPVQVRVVQNKEPNHFLSLFKGRMVVHEGGVASGFKNVQDASTDSLEGVGLYHVRGTNEVNTRGVQVSARAASLNSSDCFVLRTPTNIYVWQGSGANDTERQVATNIADVIKEGREVEQVAEGSEPAAFWEALGGQGDYPRSKTLENGNYEPRLFHCTTASRGYFTVQEVPNFTQDDLINDDVMLLDTYEEVFVWVGHDATRNERDKAIQTADEYIRNAKDGRSPDTPIFKVTAGSEPLNFTCHFHGWDDEKARDFSDPYLKKLGTLPARSEEHKSAPAAAAPAPAPAAVERVTVADTGFAKSGSTVFTLEQLKNNQAPNIDPANKELYLSDAEFEKVFGVNKAAFAAQPKWKQTQSKKQHGLF